MNITDKIDRYLNEKKMSVSDVENEIRNHLSGTNRLTTKENMISMIKTDKKTFEKAWKNLIDGGYLVKTKSGKYQWE